MHGLSKEARIWLFIAIDTVFFIIEITFGYYAHSLALIADAFHMLNDIVSLFVGLWAVRVATKKLSDSQYTYGWARAELLGGLVNGVFLMALCMTIILEAIQRFFEPQDVKNPEIVGLVGSIGLLFNILGLFIFGGHAHSHGDEEEGHEHEHEHAHARDHAHEHSDVKKPGIFGRVRRAIFGGYTQVQADDHDHDHDHDHTHADEHSAAEEGHAHGHVKNDSRISWDAHTSDRPLTAKKIHRNSVSSKKSRRGSRSYSTMDDGPVHPASLRDGILAIARGEPGDDEDDDEESAVANETTSLLRSSKNGHSHSHSHTTDGVQNGLDHSEHTHAKPSKRSAGGGHGHSHADMNLRGMFLHVLGDALGNIGVIIAAFVLWRLPVSEGWWGSQYVDPAVSLLITVIILLSAWPLCRDTAKPLLQAVPSHIFVEDIGKDIKTLPGVKECHHVHVWALTPSKLVATLDVEVDFGPGVEADAKGNEKWMALAKEIKACLHGHGIHSSTIQPEFPVPGSAASSLARRPSGLDGPSEDNAPCFLDCKDGCKTGKQCCDGPRGSKDTSGANSPH